MPSSSEKNHGSDFLFTAYRHPTHKNKFLVPAPMVYKEGKWKELNDLGEQLLGASCLA